MNKIMNIFSRFAVLGLVGLAVSATGCDSGTSTSTSSAAKSDAGDTSSAGDSTSAGAFELIGTWATPYGTDDVITQTTWNGAKLAEYDNAGNVAYTQEPATDPYNPNKFNKIIWTEPKNNAFYYCMVDYGKDTLDLAKASTLTADASAPDTAGCGGAFAWTKVTKK